MFGARRRAVLAALVSAGLIGGSAAAATADGHVDVIADGLVTPSALAVGDDGSIYVAQLFIGTLSEVSTGEARTIATGDGAGIAGVDALGRGTASYTEAGGGPGLVKRVLPNGRTRVLGDVAAHEAAENPDSVNSYGFQDLAPACADLLPADPAMLPGGGYPYSGVIDSNAYAVAILPDGSRVVADAGGNDLVLVGANGRISTLAVLPPQPATVSAEVAVDLGLPPCVAGATYNFEPVPTDVEVGPDGYLYVSLLPGGPEGPELGARGAVYKVNPGNGASTWVAGGFLGATDLAVAPNGDIYVAELFGGQISKADGTTPIPVLAAPSPAAVEYAHGDLYAAVGFFGGGQVLRIDL